MLSSREIGLPHIPCLPLIFNATLVGYSVWVPEYVMLG
jgi:hypothetical protein